MSEHREIENVRSLQEAATLLGLAGDELRDRGGSPDLIGEVLVMMRRIERTLAAPTVAARADRA